MSSIRKIVSAGITIGFTLLVATAISCAAATYLWAIVSCCLTVS